MTRSSLLLLLITLPSMGWAEVCDTERPLWTPGTQANVFTEALHLFATPLSVVLLAASLMAIAWRRQWLGLGTILGWTGLVSLVALNRPTDPTEITALAIAEGCVGSPALFIALVAAICVAIVLRTKPRPASDETET